MHIYNQQTLDDSQPYFSQCIPPWLSQAGLRAQQGKRQVSMGSALALALTHLLQYHYIQR